MKTSYLLNPVYVNCHNLAADLSRHLFLEQHHVAPHADRAKQALRSHSAMRVCHDHAVLGLYWVSYKTHTSECKIPLFNERPDMMYVRMIQI